MSEETRVKKNRATQNRQNGLKRKHTFWPEVSDR